MTDEYIRKQDVVKECGEWYVEEGPAEGFIGTVGQMLNMFSPADVAPVVHGKWIGYDDTERFTAQCGLCGNVIDTRFGSNFCPNCGAKMDGQGKE